MKRSLIGCILAITGMGAANAAVTISGTVKDTAGNPLDSIRISLQVPGAATIARDTTGANGAFSISSDSTTGKLVLRSTSMGSTSYTTKYDTIVLSGKDTVGLDIRMVPVPAPVKSSVVGKVDSAASATAVGGAIVTLRSSGAGGGATTLRDTTGADGTYSFADVTTGIYTVSVSATGYTTKSVTDTVTAAPDTVNVSLVATIVSSVSGKVDSAASAKLLAGAIVTLRSSGMGGGGASRLDTTGTDGTYSFANVAAGVYTISVSATGYTTKSVTDTVAAAPDTVNVSLVATIVSSVSGKVDSAASAKLLAGAIVTLRSSGMGGGGASRLDTTGTDGTYSFANVAAGVYTISVSATGYTTKSVTDTVAAEPDTVNFSLVATVPAKTILITGTVSDTAGNKLDSVYVSFRSTGAGAATLLRDTTGTDGAFSLTSTYLSGTYVLRLIKLKGTADTLLDTISLDSANLSVAIVWKKS
ncbi:MAG: carboxypeptidase-like regulatory domain-containing protein, partial [Fibrobacterota bacterium]